MQATHRQSLTAHKAQGFTIPLIGAQVVAADSLNVTVTLTEAQRAAANAEHETKRHDWTRR